LKASLAGEPRSVARMMPIELLTGAKRRADMLTSGARRAQRAEMLTSGSRRLERADL